MKVFQQIGVVNIEFICLSGIFLDRVIVIYFNGPFQ
jgi:hypothetical protein